jgi:hypothetical protein
MLTREQIQALSRVPKPYGGIVRVKYTEDGRRLFTLSDWDTSHLYDDDMSYMDSFTSRDYDEFIRLAQPSLAPDAEITDAMEAKMLEYAKSGAFPGGVFAEIGSSRVFYGFEDKFGEATYSHVFDNFCLDCEEQIEIFKDKE